MEHAYQNPSLSPEERTLDLLSLMTVEEKVGQMMQISHTRISGGEAEDWIIQKHAGSFLNLLGADARPLQELAGSTRLGIPLLFGIDAIHGHALYNRATVFPTQLAMSCSWNPGLVEEAGRAAAREVAADGLHWTFSPVLCIGRDARWGRINETFGEDPYLIGVLASAIIRGYQGKSLSDPYSVLACAKHYIAYAESTGGRDAVDTPATYRKIRELFLPPFKQAVEAGCATFMSGYESIDGIPVTIDRKLLTGILREELGFNGFVVTDWNNVGSLVANQRVAADMADAAAKSVAAGNDMIMSTPDFYETAVELVKKGTIPEELVDRAVKRILRLKFQMGLFENPRTVDKYDGNAIFACPAHLDINLSLTRESVVLLENRNRMLPLGNGIRKIAVIGPNADDIRAQLGDWTFFNHLRPKPDIKPEIPVYTMYEGIREAASELGIEAAYHKGCDIMNGAEKDIGGAVACAAGADMVIAVVGDCTAQNGEGKDRADLSLSGAQQELLEALKAAGRPLVAVLVNGKPLTVPWLAENADALLEMFNPGMSGGRVLAEILFGRVNPSGRLSISFPCHAGQIPVYYNRLPGWHGGKYMDMPAEPLYSFGYGLSYTSFSYSAPRLSKTVCSAGDTVTVSVDVENTGDRDGLETVQLYVGDLVSSVASPVLSLKGFKKVDVKAGRRTTVDIPLKISELYIVDPDENYIVEPGEFEILVGPDSRASSLKSALLEVRPEAAGIR